MSNNFEIWNDRIDLPREFEWVSNRDKLLSAYKDIKDWYWEENVIQNSRIIITKRENSQEDLNRWYFWSVKNRLDFLLFDTIYPEFADLDKTLRTTSNTGIQRWFRQILVNLEKKFPSGIKPTDRDFIKKEIKRIFPTIKTKEKTQFDIIFNSIYDQIKGNYRDSLDNLQNLTAIPAQNINSTPSLRKKMPLNNNEIENMNKIEISKNFSNMKSAIFSLMWNDDEIKSLIEISGKEERYWNTYCSWIFNSFAEQINVLFWDGKLIPETFYKDKNIVDIILAYFKGIIIRTESTEKYLVHTIKQILLQDDDILSKFIDDNDKQIKKLEWKIDFASIKAIELTVWEEKELENAKINNIPKEKLIEKYKIYKYLKQKEIANELDNDGKNILDALEAIFGEDWQIKRRVRLYEIKNREFNLPDLWLLHRKNGVEYATWNIKDVNPAAIVTNHNSIKKFVEWGSPSVELSNEKKREYLSELKIIYANDKPFQEGVKYLDDIWNIDWAEIRKNWITDQRDLKTIERNRFNINRMIEKMAKKRDKNELCCRKSIMTSCFRAISSFFDTVNNNWENFASEFKISDLNDDIMFDEGTWIITMKWTIWANNNHIKLYYNTKTGTLEFDNFLAYNTQDKCYKIWKWNWEREKINIQLPTMQEMEMEAKSVNFNLIDRLTPNENIYEDMLWLAMRNSIWHRCFKGFIWVDMEVNKSLVKEFNEKNILKQDIIRNIYANLYNENDINNIFNGCLVVDESNQKNQFDLIKLILNTIDNCKNANELLNFRLAINAFNECISNKDMVKKDKLLTVLLGNNLSQGVMDYVDVSKQIIQRENQWYVVDNSLDAYTYNTDNWNTNNTNEPNERNMYRLFKLFSNKKWIICTDWLNSAVAILHSDESKQLLTDMNNIDFNRNLNDCDELPFKQEELTSIENQLDEAYGIT